MCIFSIWPPGGDSSGCIEQRSPAQRARFTGWVCLQMGHGSILLQSGRLCLGSTAQTLLKVKTIDGAPAWERWLSLFHRSKFKTCLMFLCSLAQTAETLSANLKTVVIALKWQNSLSRLNMFYDLFFLTEMCRQQRVRRVRRVCSDKPKL